jgi:hypothetical protein
MVKKANLVLFTLTLFGMGFILVACGSAIPTSLAPASSGLDSIDNFLQNAVMGHIAYNAPTTMQLDQTVDIQLLLSPSASPEDLKKQIVEAGQVTAAELQVTPLMKAELISDDPQSFTIQAFHDNAEQVVLTDAPTEWRWSITAKKSGDQVLTLTLFRQIQYDGQTYWRMLETYKNKIHISVSLEQQLRKFDWYWLAGILLTTLLIPAIWRFIDRRNKKNAAGRSENG